ncbi:MAG: Gfo/Idh/MocA family protein [Propionibacteriaceae bacterium]
MTRTVQTTRAEPDPQPGRETTALLRVGVVGFGQRAQLWHEAHRPDDAVRPSRVVAVCDVSERGRSDARSALPDALVTSDLAALLDAVDAVLITTPDDQHVAVALAALRAGVAVFCEKPLAITVADCDEILQTAYATGTRLYVGHNMRHMPVVTQLRGLITSGRIGAVKAIWCRHFVGHGGDYYFKDWHADRRRTTSLLLQKGAHDLDVIHWLGGGSGRVVSALGGLTLYGDLPDRTDRTDQRVAEWLSTDNWPPTSQTGLNPVVDVEDLSMLLMRLDNGVYASYQQCHYTPDYWRNYTVIGTAGRIENLGDSPGGQIAVWDRRHDGYAPPDELISIGGATGGHGADGHGGADPLLIAEFLRFAADGGPTATSPVAARDAVAVGCVATDSLRSGGGALLVPPVDPALAAYFAAGQVR